VRRWNGWGDESVSLSLSPQARAFLEERLGPGEPGRDASFEEVCSLVPDSRLPAHPLVETGVEVRVRRARGQSLPDLVALRSGEGLAFPDGVARPRSEAEVRELLDYARRCGAALVPYGGGTSVTGGVNPPEGERPVLTVDLGRLNTMTAFDPQSRLATFGAGVRGLDLEAALRARGHTLGHFPQSFEYSTLGGWVATRSSGQQSLGYGRIEDLFAGGRLLTPEGALHLQPFPASAAGPDLRHLVLGSEGRLGIFTEATVRTRPLPEAERFYGLFFPGPEAALAAARELAQSGPSALSMLRLSDPAETGANLALAGGLPVRLLERFLELRGVAEGRCLMLLGLSGASGAVRRARRAATRVARGYGAVGAGGAPGRSWQANRFRTPYLRDALWEAGYAVDTVETATTWKAVERTARALMEALRGALGGEPVHAFSHLSHVYPSGSSIYATFVFRRSAEAGETLERWRRLKAGASEAILGEGATISHHHGVGAYHAPYLREEKGAAGVRALESLARGLDPEGRMNPGKLLPLREDQ
jgi:alkyldihydroxyacetonephosphate synthase